MEVFEHASSQMIIMFLMMAVGVIAHKARILNNEVDSALSKLVMDFALPAMIIGAVLNSDELPDSATVLYILLISTLSLGGTSLVVDLFSRLYRKSTPSEQGAHAFVMSFGNVGFIGLPVLSAIFGSNALLYAAIFNIPFNFLIFTVGVSQIKRGSKKRTSQVAASQLDSNSSSSNSSSNAPIAIGMGRGSIKGKIYRTLKSLCNPCLLSCIAAPILIMLGVTDNGGIIGNFCDSLGQLVTPGAMIVVGSNLAKMSVRDMVSHGNVYVTSFVRLVAVPLLVFFVFRNFVTDPTLLGVLVIGSAMPAAALGTIFSTLYGGSTKTVMQCTFVSTILSIVTIPLISLLFT